MRAAGSASTSTAKTTGPRWLLAELSYRCPLRCVYCSNPVNHRAVLDELDTESWIRVLREARALGAVQLGFSGGEPLVRSDLEDLVDEACRLGFYSNLITSGVGLSVKRLAKLKALGLDHIQLSLQDSRAETNDRIAGAKVFERKMRAAEAIKAAGFPMVLNVVLHRHNVDHVAEILDLALRLQADYVELANAQYDGWAYLNREALLPDRAQLDSAENTVKAFRETHGTKPKIYYVVPDYFEGRPKACGGGWATSMMVIAPDGMALPCHGARKLPLPFPNVSQMALGDIWHASPAFQKFRGLDWLPASCRSCPEREKDFGGCRCQAYLMTGDMHATDPACDRVPSHELVRAAVAAAGSRELTYRGGESAGAF